MSESLKRSEPEPVIPSRAPRARVSNHLRHLLALGATSATLACWPLACDPIPTPAACRDKLSVLGSIEATVTLVSGLELELKIRLRQIEGAFGVALTRTGVTGGSATVRTPTDSEIKVERVLPANFGSVIELTYSATCEGTASKGIRVTLTPRATDGGAADAGAADGGAAAGGYDVALTEL